MTDKPRYKHPECSACRFVMHVSGMDIYICASGSSRSWSLIARHSDRGEDYNSMLLWLFRDLLCMNAPIGSTVPGDTWSMPFRDYIMSDKAAPYFKAWLMVIMMIVHDDGRPDLRPQRKEKDDSRTESSPSVGS